MERLEKMKGLSPEKADAAADIGLINTFSRRELTPEEVYCFSVVLCDNDVDRDLEQFTDATLEKLAGLFVGKTGIVDHQWTANGQIARLYRVEVEQKAEKNSLGQPLKILRGSAYMLRTDKTQPYIDAIEAGIIKEVSVGCAIRRATCSICGAGYGTCEHIKGQEYDGRMCVCELDEPTDAYEFSFVAVPAQRNAGITKSLKSLDDALEMLKTADLSGHGATIKEILPKLQEAVQADNIRMERARILAENKKFLKG